MLHFYIDPDHYPYNYNDAVSVDAPENAAIKTELSSANTWLLWTLRTYLELKAHYSCKLVDQMPEEGVVFFFRGSISMDARPSRKQFWICMVADGTWHPYSQINIFQNPKATHEFGANFFIRHWPPQKIIKNEQPSQTLKQLYYMGDVNNLATELRSADWHAFLEQQQLQFICPPLEKWDDYNHVDAILAIRSFDGNTYQNKPASKLINAWLGNVIFIGTSESAYAAEIKNDFDMVVVKGYADLKSILIKLKTDLSLLNKYQQQAKKNSEKYQPQAFRNDWINLIEQQILPLSTNWFSKTALGYKLYLITRIIGKKTFAIKHRIA